MNEQTSSSGSATLLSLPVQAPVGRLPQQEPPLVARLAEVCGARWIDAASLDAWLAEGGDRVILFAGDAVRFPEGQDVAVVLPELRRCASRTFEVAIVPRASEEALARRWGSNRWPTLLFLRDGQYVGTLSGMHDWDDYLREVETLLARPPSRPPTIGIPVVGAGAGATSCH